MKAIWMLSRYPQMHFPPRFIFSRDSFSFFLPNVFSSFPSSPDIYFVMMEFYGFISLFQLFFSYQKIIFFSRLFLLFRGILYQNQQKYEDAVSSFQKAIHFRPSLACKYHSTSLSVPVEIQ